MRRRLRIALIAAAAAVVVFLFVRPAQDAPEPSTAFPGTTTTQPDGTVPADNSPSAGPPPEPSTGAATEPPPTPAGEPDAPPAEAEQQWRPVLDGFAADFADPGPDWVPRISRWTTPYLAETYADVDPREVPIATLVDLQIGATGAYTVDATATYDTGLTIGLRAELSPDGWQITTVEPLTDGTITG